MRQLPKVRRTSNRRSRRRGQCRAAPGAESVIRVRRRRAYRTIARKSGTTASAILRRELVLMLAIRAMHGLAPDGRVHAQDSRIVSRRASASVRHHRATVETPPRLSSATVRVLLFVAAAGSCRRGPSAVSPPGTRPADGSLCRKRATLASDASRRGAGRLAPAAAGERVTTPAPDRRHGRKWRSSAIKTRRTERESRMTNGRSDRSSSTVHGTRQLQFSTLSLRSVS